MADALPTRRAGPPPAAVLYDDGGDGDEYYGDGEDEYTESRAAEWALRALYGLAWLLFIGPCRLAAMLARLAGRRLMRDGGWLPRAISWEPHSVAEQARWAKSKEWLHPDCDPGGPTDIAGTLFYRTIGTHWYAFFIACAGACSRPRRFIPAFAVTAVLAALMIASVCVLVFVVL